MNKENESGNYNIKSLIKSVKLLETLVEGGEMSINELDSISKMGKSTVHRILGTFKAMGYVAQKNEDGKYYATIKMFELGNRVADRITIRNIARPYMEELFYKCRETVNLAILDKSDVVYLDKITTEEPLRIDLEVGRRVPAYCSGLGKVFMAYTPNYDLGTIQFVRHTPLTIASAGALREELALVRKQGYAIDNEEYIKGLICLAVPVLNPKGDIVAALSIALPSIRLDKQKMALFIEYLLDTAKKIHNVIW